jgi:DEAD/DEAH box helicase domain-containing protein
MVARLRRLREERELREPSPQPSLPLRESEPIEPRFATGDQIFCLPYGEGTVRSSRIMAGKELLTVVFPEHGELMVDPSISAVRKIEEPHEEPGDG